jgi:hypothetical protein
MAKISTYPLEGNPKLSDKLIGTSVGLNQIGNLENPTYNFSLQQLLDLFSPLLPGNTLQGVLDNNNAATQDINLNGTIYTDGLEVSGIANIFSAYIYDSIYIEASLFDRNNSQGTAGQILTSTGSGVEWFTPVNTTPTLQQVLTSGNEADVDMILTANLTAELITANDILVQDSFELSGTFLDSNGLTGTSGQMLVSLGTGVEWQDVPLYTASSPLFINPATKNITIQQANGTQNGYLSFADWITFDGKQNALSGTGIVVSNSGTITYITNNSANWNQAYNDSILSAVVTGTTTKLLTLTQRDGDTITATWTESGVAGFVPYVGATSNVDLGANDLIADSIIKSGGTSSQFLKADGSVDSSVYITSAALTPYLLITTAASTYFPIPTGTTSQYVRGDGSLATFPSLTGFVPYTGATANLNLGSNTLLASDLVINHSSGSGVAASITKGGNGEALTVLKTSGSGNAASILGGVTLLAELNLNTGLADAYIASASVWNAKQNAISLTTTGTSGAATFIGNVLNIPQYTPDLSGYVPTSRTLTINGTAFDLSANRSWSVGTVTSVGLTSATSGITIGSSPITSSGNITLAIATASGSQQGLLSSTDWTTFNNKQNALTNPITGTGTLNFVSKFTSTGSALGNSQIFDDGTNVGIGTTSPGVKFVNSLSPFSSGPTLGVGNVGSQALLSNTGLYGLYSGVSDNGDVWHQVQRNDGSTAVYNIALQPSGGGLYLGTNAPIYGTSAKLQILFDGLSVFGINFRSTAVNSIPIHFTSSTGIQTGYIFQDATSVALVSVSDYRLKEDLNSFDGLDLISKINVYDYKWKNQDKRTFGVMAHELQEVVPQSAFGKKDGETMQGVDYSSLVPILIQAIKELEAKISTLK